MSLYITAQLIGFLGFLLLTGAPYLKNKKSYIKVEITGCAILSLQWLMLAQPGMAIMDSLNITHSLSVLKAEKNARVEKALPLFYPLSLIILLLVTKSTVLCALCVIGFFSIMRAKNSKDMITFRSFALLATLAFTCAGYFALSIPAVIFGIVRISIHSYRLAELLELNKPWAQQIKINA